MASCPRRAVQLAVRQASRRLLHRLTRRHRTAAEQPGIPGCDRAGFAAAGLDRARKEKQSDRLAHYDTTRDRLIASGRLYPCHETPEELEFRRKRLLSRGGRRSTTAPPSGCPTPTGFDGKARGVRRGRSGFRASAALGRRDGRSPTRCGARSPRAGPGRRWPGCCRLSGVPGPRRGYGVGLPDACG